MDNKEFVSIIMPVYNGEKYLAISIQSCLNQIHSNLELIIVNDCSTDNSLTIAIKFQEQDKRIVIINNKNNLKLPASLNIGHRAAKGDFITWTSDDNIYNENAISLLLKNLKANNADFIYSDIAIIDIKGKKVKNRFHLSLENILFGNFIGSCFLYRKAVFEKNKEYNEDLFLVEDYDFWLRASLHSKFYHLKEILYNYRLHGDSLTNSISYDRKKNKLYRNNIKVMYMNFTREIMKENHEVIANFQTNILTHQKIEFDWLKKNNKVIFKFMKKINKFQNFVDEQSLKRLFMNKATHVLISNSDRKYNISRSMFIIAKFYNVLNLNTIKTLIKYSFFKK